MVVGESCLKSIKSRRISIIKIQLTPLLGPESSWWWNLVSISKNTVDLLDSLFRLEIFVVKPNSEEFHYFFVGASKIVVYFELSSVQTRGGEGGSCCILPPLFICIIYKHNTGGCTISIARKHPYASVPQPLRTLTQTLGTN